MTPLPRPADVGLALVVLGLALCGAPDPAYGQESPVAGLIRTLQPRVTAERAERLALVVQEAADTFSFEPRLLVALIMRESSFRPEVESLAVRGPQGESGLMQLHPRGGWRQVLPEGCTARLEGARCQVLTGTAWLARARTWCPGNWRPLAAYGTGRCRPEAQAERDLGVIRLRGLLARLPP